MISSTPYTDARDISEATVSVSDPYGSCYDQYNLASTVWYVYTPEGDGTLSLFTSGSDFSNTVTVWNINWYEVGCFAGYPNASGSLSVTGGVTYYIMIAGIINDPYNPYPTGAKNLNFLLNYEPIQRPANDMFADAKLIPDNQPYSDWLIDENATVETGEPRPSCISELSRTVWYSFTPTGDGTLSGNFGSLYVSMAVYVGSGLDNLSEVHCYPAGSVNFSVKSGVTYYLQLSEIVPWNWGDVALNVAFYPHPSNDNYDSAKVIILDESQPFTDEFLDNGASLESGEPIPDCGYGLGRSVWYTFTPAYNGRVSTNYRIMGDFLGNVAIMGVYTGSDFNNLAQYKCEYYNGGLDFPVTAGTTYYVQLGGMWDWAFGQVSLNLSFTKSPPNDNFADATLISLSELPYTAPINVYAATEEPGEPWPSCLWWDDNPTRTVWYRFTPNQTKAYTIDNIHSYWRGFTAVYSGISLNMLTEIGCRNEFHGSQLSFIAEAGKEYFIELGKSNWYHEDTSLDFRLKETPPPFASFDHWPGDANSLENVFFYNYSRDDYEIGISRVVWNFGDGTTSEESESCTPVR